MPRVAGPAVDKRLVSKAVPLGELMTGAKERSTQIAGLDSTAVQPAKRAMIRGRDVILHEDLGIEGELLPSLKASKDDAINRGML